MIDINAVEKEAEAQIREEQSNKAKGALVAQMRRVAVAEQNLTAEKLKLADIKAQIADGTLPA